MAKSSSSFDRAHAKQRFPPSHLDLMNNCQRSSMSTSFENIDHWNMDLSPADHTTASSHVHNETRIPLLDLSLSRGSARHRALPLAHYQTPLRPHLVPRLLPKPHVFPRVGVNSLQDLFIPDDIEENLQARPRAVSDETYFFESATASLVYSRQSSDSCHSSAGTEELAFYSAGYADEKDALRKQLPLMPEAEDAIHACKELPSLSMKSSSRRSMECVMLCLGANCMNSA